MANYPYDPLDAPLDVSELEKLNNNYQAIQADIQSVDSKTTQGLNNQQQQINNLVADGDSSPEAAQARVGATGTNYDTLKERLDAEYPVTSSRLYEESIPSSKLRTTMNEDRIKIENLSDEVLQAMAGNTPVNATPGVNSVTTEKVANNAITVGKTDFITVGKNLFNKDSAVVGKFVNQTTGVIEDSASSTVSSLIQVSANTNYVFSPASGNAKRYAFYNASGVFISGALSATSTFTTPANTAYIRYSFATTEDATKQQLELGTTATAYESFGYQMPKVKVIADNAISSGNIKPMAVTQDKIGFALPKFAQNKNLFDKSKVTVGFFINQTNGTLSANSTHVASDFIPVVGSTQYSLTTDAANRIAYYDINKVFISGAQAPASPVTTPSTAVYVRISYSELNVSRNSVQFEQGATLSPYNPFGFTTTELITGSASKLVTLPPNLYGIVGQELNIYFDNVIEGRDKDFTFDVVSSRGQQFENYWRFVPTVAETFTVTVNAYVGETLLGSATSSVIVKAATVGAGGNKKVLIIGDSTTNSGFAVTKLNENFNNDPMDITLLGTRGTAPNVHEGRSGWKASDYTTLASLGGVTNAFWNPGTSAFDFGYYIAQNSIATPDYVVINLGINDTFNYFDDATLLSEAANIVARFNTMVASIKAYNATIKIGIAITIPPNYSQDAFGKDYGSAQTLSRYKRNNILWVNYLITTFKNREAESLYLVPIHTNLDTRYNFTTEQKQVNARNTATYTSSASGSGVHPAETGYWQVADIYWYWLKSFEV